MTCDAGFGPEQVPLLVEMSGSGLLPRTAVNGPVVGTSPGSLEVLVEVSGAMLVVIVLLAVKSGCWLSTS